MSQTVSKQEIKELSRLSKEEWREYTKTVWNIANTVHPDHPAVFPLEIPHRLIKLFTFWGDTVLDPFGGTGTTAIAALKLNRNAIIVDQNSQYVALATQAAAPLAEGDTTFQGVVADSRRLNWIEDESIGLVVTSPPYWNKADYGQSDMDLGRIDGYVDFVNSLGPTFEECFRTLMPGRKLCVVTANVSQHTDHGLLMFPLATDILVLLRSTGFAIVNEIIWNKNGTGGRWGSWGAQRPIFGSYPYPPNFLFKTVHEYVLIVSKPPASPTRGPKVQPLAKLMSDSNGNSNGHRRVTSPADINGSRRNPAHGQ